MNDLISVIVPCYNVAKYIEKCVDSIRSQTYTNLEIFLINDGSTDDTLAIIERFAKIDKRIIIIDKENGGQSDARNVALDKISGDYVVFVDGDDYILPDHISSLYNIAINNSCDIAVSPFTLVNESETFVKQNTKVERCFSNIEALETMFYQKLFDTTPHCKIYKSHLFKNIRFRKGIVFEDLYTIPDLILGANKVAYTSYSSYAYILHSNSTEGSPFSELKWESLKAIMKKFEDSKEFSTIPKARDCRLFSIMSRIYFAMPSNHKGKKELWQKIKRKRLSVLFNNKARIKNRIAALMTFFGPQFSSVFYSIQKRR